MLSLAHTERVVLARDTHADLGVKRMLLQLLLLVLGEGTHQCRLACIGWSNDEQI